MVALIAAVAALSVPVALHVGRPAPSASPAPVPSLANGTDAAWLKLMIAMNESTVVLLDRAASRATDPRLATFAKELAAKHRDEIGVMRGITDRHAIVVTNEHDGHELPGIVTPADLARIEAQVGAEFDAAVRECLREHLEQGARLAGSEQRAGQDGETKAFAARVEQARQADLARM